MPIWFLFAINLASFGPPSWNTESLWWFTEPNYDDGHDDDGDNDMNSPFPSIFFLSLFFFKDFNILVFRFCSGLKELPIIKISVLFLCILKIIVLISHRKCVLSKQKKINFFWVSLLRCRLLSYWKWFQDKRLIWLTLPLAFPEFAHILFLPFLISAPLPTLSGSQDPHSLFPKTIENLTLKWLIHTKL